jgi:uncharacterized protein YndB with AHSA1/START domain
MSVTVEVSEVIDRPLVDVFRFFADDHVRNHPRWDPEMELEQESEGPVAVGTRIRRRATRGGTTVEGTMEVVEYEPNRAFGMVIHDGPMEMRGRATFEAADQNRTTLAMSVEIPGADESMDTSSMTAGMRRSLGNIKRLIESGA